MLNITTTTAQQVFTGQGTLQAVIINNTSEGIVTLVDGTSISTDVGIGIIAASTLAGDIQYGVSIARGLRVTQAATGNITIVYTTG